MLQQRIYKTNIDYESALDVLEPLAENMKHGVVTNLKHEIIKNLMLPEKKGHPTFYFRRFPHVRVQITRKGWLMLHGGSILDDSRIIKDLMQVLKKTHRDGLILQLNKLVLGDREKDKMLRDEMEVANFWQMAFLKGKEWYERRAKEWLNQWDKRRAENNPKVKEVQEMFSRVTAKVEVAMILRGGVHCDKKRQIFVFNEKAQMYHFSGLDTL